MTAETLKAMVDEATDRLTQARESQSGEAGIVDDAAKLLADMMAMGDVIGLSAR